MHKHKHIQNDDIFYKITKKLAKFQNKPINCILSDKYFVWRSKMLLLHYVYAIYKIFIEKKSNDSFPFGF